MVVEWLLNAERGFSRGGFVVEYSKQWDNERRRVGGTNVTREKGLYEQQSPVEKPSFIYLHCVLERGFCLDIGPWPLLMPLFLF